MMRRPPKSMRALGAPPIRVLLPPAWTTPVTLIRSPDRRAARAAARRCNRRRSTPCRPPWARRRGRRRAPVRKYRADLIGGGGGRRAAGVGARRGHGHPRRAHEREGHRMAGHPHPERAGARGELGRHVRAPPAARGSAVPASAGPSARAPRPAPSRASASAIAIESTSTSSGLDSGRPLTSNILRDAPADRARGRRARRSSPWETPPARRLSATAAAAGRIGRPATASC